MLDSNISDQDQNVLSYMMQIVQEKHGENVAYDFLQSESEKIYELFGNRLFDYFEPMLSAEQKEEFDKLVEEFADQDKLMSFLVDSIPNIEEKIMLTLEKFKEDYLQGNIN